MSESAVDNIEAAKPKQETEEEMTKRHKALEHHAKKRRERRAHKQRWKYEKHEAAETLLTLNGNGGGHKKYIKF